MEETTRFSVLYTGDYERIIISPLPQYFTENNNGEIKEEIYLLKKENVEHFQYESSFRKYRQGDFVQIIETPEIYFNKILPIQKLRIEPYYFKKLFEEEYNLFSDYNFTFTIDTIDKKIEFKMILSPEPNPPINIEHKNYADNFPWKYMVYYQYDKKFKTYINEEERWYSVRQLEEEHVDIIRDLKEQIINKLGEKFGLERDYIYIYTRHNPSLYPYLTFEVIYIKNHSYIYEKKYLYDSKVDIDLIIQLLETDKMKYYTFNYLTINKYLDLITDQELIEMDNKISTDNKYILDYKEILEMWEIRNKKALGRVVLPRDKSTADTGEWSRGQSLPVHPTSVWKRGQIAGTSFVSDNIETLNLDLKTKLESNIEKLNLDLKTELDSNNGYWIDNETFIIETQQFKDDDGVEEKKADQDKTNKMENDKNNLQNGGYNAKNRFINLKSNYLKNKKYSAGNNQNETKRYINYVPLHRRINDGNDDHDKLCNFLNNYLNITKTEKKNKKGDLIYDIKEISALDYGYYILRLNTDILSDTNLKLQISNVNFENNDGRNIELDFINSNKNKTLKNEDLNKTLKNEDLNKNFLDIVKKYRKDHTEVVDDVLKGNDKKTIANKNNNKLRDEWKRYYTTISNIDYGHFHFLFSSPRSKNSINMDMTDILDNFGCLRFLCWHEHENNDNFNGIFDLFNSNSSSLLIWEWDKIIWLKQNIEEIISTIKNKDVKFFKDKYFRVVCHYPSNIGFHFHIIVFKNINNFANKYEYEYNHIRTINLNPYLLDKKKGNIIPNYIKVLGGYGNDSNEAYIKERKKNEKYIKIIRYFEKKDKIYKTTLNTSKRFNYKLEMLNYYDYYVPMLFKMIQKIKKIDKIDKIIKLLPTQLDNDKEEISKKLNIFLFGINIFQIHQDCTIFISDYNMYLLTNDTYQRFKICKHLILYKYLISNLYFCLKNFKSDKFILKLSFHPYNIIVDTLELLNKYFNIKNIDIYEYQPFHYDKIYLYLYNLRDRNSLIKDLYNLLSNVNFKENISFFKNDSITTADNSISKHLIEIYLKKNKLRNKIYAKFI